MLSWHSQDLVNLHLLLLALHLDRAQRTNLHETFHPVPRTLTDEDLPRLRVGLEPRRQIHAVADHRVLHPLLGAHRSRHRLSGADPDSDVHTLLALLGPF